MAVVLFGRNTPAVCPGIVSVRAVGTCVGGRGGGPCWLILWDFHPAAPRGSLRRLSLKDLAEEMKAWLGRERVRRGGVVGALFGASVDRGTRTWLTCI